VQHVRVGDLHVVGQTVQEVKEVLDGVRRSAVRRPPDGPEQVLHVGMHRHLSVDGKYCFRIFKIIIIIYFSSKVVNALFGYIGHHD